MNTWPDEHRSDQGKICRHIYRGDGIITTTKRTWTAIKAKFTTELKKRDDAEEVAATITAGIIWWGAAVFAVALSAGTAIVKPITSLTKKPSVKAANPDGDYVVPMASFFPRLKGSTNDFNVGGLFVACCFLVKVQGWATAITAEAWKTIGAKYGLHTNHDMHAVSTALRKWYVGPKDGHTKAGLKAVIAEALGTATAEAEAEAEAVATAKADRAAKAKAKATAKKTESRMQRTSDGMTRAKAKADALAWNRSDPAGFRADAMMRASIITADDKAKAKAKAAAETANETAKAKATATAKAKAAA